MLQCFILIYEEVLAWRLLPTKNYKIEMTADDKGINSMKAQGKQFSDIVWDRGDALRRMGKNQSASLL
jgi:hypothetical protein